MDLSTLSQQWDALAAHWHAVLPRQPHRAEQILARVLEAGVESQAEDEASVSSPATAQQALDCEVALLRASGLFDAEAYLAANLDVAQGGIDPLRHFCRHGWAELRNPNRDFDIWWYWVNHMDPTRKQLNPLLHYLLHGRRLGFDTQPSSPPHGEATCYEEGRQVRRICLFAGYDPDGLMDEHVVRYLRELSRHADVYYLADCDMEREQLSLVAGVTRGAWALRHGEYDFGSFSRLARDLVGWGVIETYDELILANDSCYLLGSLDQALERMDTVACDWWGMQLTKRNFAGVDTHDGAMPMEEVRDTLLPDTELSYINSLHVSSYFVVYRKPVIDDAGFRRRLDMVTAQDSKSDTIRKYEIGISRYLLSQGYRVDAFIPGLHGYHPVYTARHFELIERGFPFLKRLLLSDNPLDAPDLGNWKQRVLQHVPNAPTEMMERNLLRVASHDKLRRSMRIVTRDDGDIEVPRLLRGRDFAVADSQSPKFDHWWLFPVDPTSHLLSGNARALFEEVRNDPSIRKIILTRSKRVELDGENVVSEPLHSPEGQFHLLRARQVFIGDTPGRSLDFALSPRLHNLVHLGRGLSFRRIGHAASGVLEERGKQVAENSKCRAAVSASRIDTLAVTAAMYPLSYNRVWCTGLPRNDFVLCPDDRLPSDMQQESEKLRFACGGRRLILFDLDPKGAEGDGKTFPAGVAQVDKLHVWLREHNAVLGIREGEVPGQPRHYHRILRGRDTLDLSARHYPHTEVLHRQATALVTDYSDGFIDFMLTGRPVIGFPGNEESGIGPDPDEFFYDMGLAFPGPICMDFSQLLDAMTRAFEAGCEGLPAPAYAWKRKRFFDHLDDGNAWRVAKRVKQLYVRKDVATDWRM